MKKVNENGTSGENPTYMAVAFDIGKNFRKEKYDFYKEGRIDTPEELKIQMPIAREILDAWGIKHFELAPYEADDIIGTIAKMTEEDPDFVSVIVSSDKDLLQLISDETEVKLLKQTGFIRYNHETFLEDYKIEPIRIIDLKALMGDASDNIPGVKGIGEKTALKLLQEYGSLDNIYANLDNIKGKVQEKLAADKENAYMSRDIATIYREVPLNITLEDLKFSLEDDSILKEKYQELQKIIDDPYTEFAKRNALNASKKIAILSIPIRMKSKKLCYLMGWGVARFKANFSEIYYTMRASVAQGALRVK